MIYTIIGTFREDLLSGLSLYFGESLKKEVILMHERRKHIEKDHGGEMTEAEMEEMLGALQTVISDPDHVFEDERNKGSILLIRRIKGTLNLNVVVRLALARDGTGRENSVITCFLLRDSNLVKLEKKHRPLPQRRHDGRPAGLLRQQERPRRL
mgnify:CR=1 FL=1